MYEKACFRASVQRLIHQLEKDPQAVMKRAEELVKETDPEVVAANDDLLDYLEVNYEHLMELEKIKAAALAVGKFNSSPVIGESGMTEKQFEATPIQTICEAEADARRFAAQAATETAKPQAPVIKWMPIKEAVAVLERKKLVEAAMAVERAERTIEERDKDDLLYIFEKLQGLRFPGTLQMTLDHINEGVAAVLLELMIEKREEAEEFTTKARQAKGLRRDGLERCAKQARKESYIFFEPVGMAAIERLIKRNRLPKVVMKWLPPRFVEEIREKPRPATLLMAKLNPRTE